jgi:adiponectin receptor
MLINEWVFDNYGDPFVFTPSVPYFCLLGLSYLGGLYIYTIRCPERNHPGKYNICGHSHQIWHGMVVLGILFTYLGALQNFEMRKTSVCPA